MPSSNINVALGTGAIIVVTVVAAAAIAVYESPEVRQFAEQCRRRIAIALHTLGDEIHPRRPSESRQPRFNRPEDAQGFMQSSAEPGVEADEDTKRRQREELMYWNNIRLEKLSKEKQRPDTNQTKGQTFDDFLQEDRTAEKGTYIYRSGVDVHEGVDDGLIRRRGEGVRGLNQSVIYANPFEDENCLEMSEQRRVDRSLMSPTRSEISGGIYDASESGRQTRETTETLAHEPLVDLSETTTPVAAVEDPAPSNPAVHEQATNFQNEFTADTESNPDCAQSMFESIRAWSDGNSGHHHPSFYSPLPVTPQTPLSEASKFTGVATPADSISVAGSGEYIGYDNASSAAGPGDCGILSEEEDGIHTPTSWSEVGSVVSDIEHT